MSFAPKLAMFYRYMQALLIILFMSVFLFFSPEKTYSAQARIKNTVITNGKQDLLVYFSVDGSFTPKIEEAIKGGIPTTFIYRLVLYNKSGNNPSSKIISAEISHTIKYDTLKKEYIVSMSEKKEPLLTTDYDKARAAMSGVSAFPLIALDRLTRESRYLLQLKAELDTIKLPPIINYLFFFVSYWDFETDWEMVEFVH